MASGTGPISRSLDAEQVAARRQTALFLNAT
jgi:hypothetical protein